MLLRNLRYLAWELKQSYWLAVLAFALMVFTYIAFFALHFSPRPEVHAQSIDMLTQMSIVLIPLGACLLGYLITGGVFEKARRIFQIKQQHFLFGALIRISGVFLLLYSIEALIACLLVRDAISNILPLLFRAACVSMFYLSLIAIIDFVLHAPFIGLMISLFLITGSYSAFFGWIQPPKWWMAFTTHLGPSYYSLVIFGAALFFIICLYACEHFPTNRR